MNNEAKFEKMNHLCMALMISTDASISGKLFAIMNEIFEADSADDETDEKCLELIELATKQIDLMNR